MLSEVEFDLELKKLLITNIERIFAKDVEKFAWNGLSLYANRELCFNQLQKLHSPPEKQKRNVRKQAEHIRQAILLAKEYYETSKVASLATRPVLLYYSCMSLALAEILLKQDGRSSLDLARNDHNHHGLVFSSSITFDLDFLKTSKMLKSKPMKVGKNYKGTFELWRRSARHLPIVGTETQTFPRGLSTTAVNPLLFENDSELVNIDDRGVTLIECFMRLPFMERTLRVNGCPSFFVRGEASKTFDIKGVQYFNLLIHPASSQSLEKLLNIIVASPEMVNFLEIDEYERGLLIRWLQNEYSLGLAFHFPSGLNLNTKMVYFGTDSMRMNEFGNIYLSLFMLSNLSRYYPDIWIKHIENHTSFSLVVSEFCEKAAERMALMAYSELSRTLYIE